MYCVSVQGEQNADQIMIGKNNEKKQICNKFYKQNNILGLFEMPVKFKQILKEWS